MWADTMVQIEVECSMYENVTVGGSRDSAVGAPFVSENNVLLTSQMTQTFTIAYISMMPLGLQYASPMTE